MHRRCQDRIRGYFYKTVEQIKSSDSYKNCKKARQRLTRVIAFLKLQLKEDHYFGHYFDRSRVRVALANSDVTDGQDRSCYEHCPCQITIYLPLEEKLAVDEVDAKKCTKDDDTSEDDQESVCFYRVSQSKTRQQIVLCDRRGEFKCGGVWKVKKCQYGERHRINPYRSREELIVFSTWNLDHK